MYVETFLFDVQFSYAVLFHKKKTKNVIENLFLLFEVIARKHVRYVST